MKSQDPLRTCPAHTKYEAMCHRKKQRVQKTLPARVRAMPAIVLFHAQH